MGNQTGSDLPVSRPSQPGEWTLQGRTDYCELIRNNFTHQLAEQYIVPTPPGISLLKNQSMYQHRRTNNTHTVAVYHIEKEQGNYLCQGQDYLRVRTERIPTRLSDLKFISDKEAIKIVQGMLEGYKSLFGHFGGFHISDEMVGINQKGQVKVWININFASNSVEYSPNLSNRIVSQGDMVNQVFSLVEQHLQARAFSQSFKDAVLRKYPKTFDQAIQMIQTYQSKNHSQMVSSMQQSTVSVVKGHNNISKRVQAQPQNTYSNFHSTQPSSAIYQSQPILISQSPQLSFTYQQQHSHPSQSYFVSHISQPENHHQQTIKTQAPVVIEKSRIVQSPPQHYKEHHLSSQNVLTYHQQVKPIVQQTLNPTLLKSKIQDHTHPKQNRLFLRTQIPHEKNIASEKSFILENNRFLQLDQSSLKVQQPSLRTGNQQTVRRSSLNNYRTFRVQTQKKAQPANIQSRKFTNKNQKRTTQTNSFTSKSATKQIVTEHNKDPKSIAAVSFKVQSSSIPTATAQNNISNISSKTTTNKNSPILFKQTNNNKSDVLINPATIQKQQFRAFPKPSIAAQRTNIQKVEKPSANSSRFQMDMINALNGISGIEDQNNKTISKQGDQILGDIQSPLEFHSSGVDSVNPEIRKMMANPASLDNRFEHKTIRYQSLAPANSQTAYQYEFQKTKIMPSTYNYQPKQNTAERNITTPRFQHKTNSSKDQSSNNLLSAQIQRLIQEHQADKQELLKKINQYQRSSRFNRATYDLPKIESNQTLKNSKTSNTSNDYVVADLYKELDIKAKYRY